MYVPNNGDVDLKTAEIALQLEYNVTQSYSNVQIVGRINLQFCPKEMRYAVLI